MKLKYQIILSPINEGLLVYIPDLDINTSGKNLTEAVDMAKDAISLWCITEQDMGREIPIPSAALFDRSENDIVAWADVDLDAYRSTLESSYEAKKAVLPY